MNRNNLRFLKNIIEFLNVNFKIFCFPINIFKININVRLFIKF